MKRTELLEKCAGETWVASSQVKITPNAENTVYSHDIGGLHIVVKTSKGDITLWLMRHHDKLEDAIFESNTTIKDAPIVMEAATIVASLFNIELPELVVPTVERAVETQPDAQEQVPVTTTKEAELGGMVMAYEKILIGRQVTVGK